MTRAAWGAAASRRQRALWAPGQPTHLEVHHSVTPASWTLEYACRQIQQMHFGNGWADAFYNVALHPDGRLAELAPWGRISGSGLPAFTVCLLGNYENDTITAAQEATLLRLYRILPHGLTYHQERAATLRAGGDRSSKSSPTACCGRNAIYWVQLARLAPPYEEKDMGLAPDEKVMFAEMHQAIVHKNKDGAVHSIAVPALNAGHATMHTIPNLVKGARTATLDALAALGEKVDALPAPAAGGGDGGVDMASVPTSVLLAEVARRLGD